MKKVSQGGTELIMFKRQERGDWVGRLLLEAPYRPGRSPSGKIRTPSPRKDLALFFSQTSGQKKTGRLNSLLS